METRGKLRDVTGPRDTASDIGRHWVAINKFLETNDLSHLEAFVGLELRDSQGRSIRSRVVQCCAETRQRR
jgi:hypothetical protein